jgi:hypothetical protein
MRPNLQPNSKNHALHPPEQQSHQWPPALVASKPEPPCLEESCVDERRHKIIRCIPLLPPHPAVHGDPIAEVSRGGALSHGCLGTV